MKIAEVEPAAIVTLEGTVALELLEDRMTTVPPEGAWPFKVTVPVDELPPSTDAGDTLTAATVSGLICNAAVKDVLPDVAVRVAVAAVETDVVVTVNVVDDEPYGTVTLDGTVAFEFLEFNVNVTPPEGAGDERVTVAVEGVPPANDGGFKDRLAPESLMNSVTVDRLP